METSDEAAVLDAAFRLAHGLNPEFGGRHSSHATMVAEVMVRRGHADDVEAWLDRYRRRLEPMVPAAEPIAADRWRDALGDPRRLGDWIEYLQREIHDQPWRGLLATWWPRLAPGILAGACHGAIRTGHAIRALRAAESRSANAPARLDELAHALACWAARWHPAPGAAAGPGTLDPGPALDSVPPVADLTVGLWDRVGLLASTPGWLESLARPRMPDTPEQAMTLLAALADAAVERYVRCPPGSAVMAVHAATVSAACLEIGGALPAEFGIDVFKSAWAAAAALAATFPIDPGSGAPPASGNASSSVKASQIMAVAIAHGDEHAIKFADVALDCVERTSSETALRAASHCIDMLPRSTAE